MSSSHVLVHPMILLLEINISYFFLKTSKVTLNYLLLILFCSSQWNRAVLVACTLGLSYGSLAIEESLDGLCCEECVHDNFWSYNLK
jgi:hypothetical protein